MATMEANATNNSLPAEVGNQLKRAQKKIANLLEDIGRLSDELQRKDSLLTTLKSRLPALSSWLETTQTGELQHHSATTALRDTVVWEPSSSSCQRPSCSTPSGGTPWSEVVVRSRKRGPGGAPGRAPCGVSPSVGIRLTNKFSALSMSSEPAVPGAADPDVSQLTDAVPRLSDTTAFPPLRPASGDGRPAPGRAAPVCAAPGRSPPSSRPSFQRKRLLRDAVRWHTSPHLRAPDGDGGVAEPAANPGQLATTLLIGDSLIRNVRLRGAFTLCFPGATVPDITEKIPDVLTSHPQVNRVVIHVGTNDTSRQQSELLKRDFTQLFNKLQQHQLSVFISGPTPTCGRGIGRFSRLLSLNTWLSSACSTHRVGFVDNFDAFWERRHLFSPDGLHLNRAGARMLSANLAYGLQHTLPSLSSHHPKHTQTELSTPE